VIRDLRRKTTRLRSSNEGTGGEALSLKINLMFVECVGQREERRIKLKNKKYMVHNTKKDIG
jgi:hypothetical protein